MNGLKPEFGDEPYQYVTARFRIPEGCVNDISVFLEEEFEKGCKSGLIHAFKKVDDWGLQNPKCYKAFGGVGFADVIDNYLIAISRGTLELLARESEIEKPEGWPKGRDIRMHDLAVQWAHILFRQCGLMDKGVDGGVALKLIRK